MLPLLLLLAAFDADAPLRLDPVDGVELTPRPRPPVTQELPLARSRAALEEIRVVVLAVPSEGQPSASDGVRALGFHVTTTNVAHLRDDIGAAHVLVLPSCWAQDQTVYGALQQMAPAIHAFIARGGGVVVSQPNPYRHQGESARPALLPYPVTFSNWYRTSDFDRVILAPHHFITAGLPANAMPFPADRFTEVDRRYTILARGDGTQSPSLVVGAFGDGRVVVHGDDDRLVPPETLRRMIIWAAHRDA